MRASRKGTRLNDAQYFKNPLPHTRQRMTTMFLLQRVSDLERKYSFDTDDLVADVQFGGRMRNRGKKINLNDTSIEMGSVIRQDNDSRGGLNANEFSEGEFRREVFVETNESLGEGLSKAIVTTTDRSDDVTIANVDGGKQQDEIIENDEIRGEKTNDGHVRRENKRHSSSRWKNSWISQLFLHVFSQLTGKGKRKDTMNDDEDNGVVRKSRSYLEYSREEDIDQNEKSREEVVSTFVRQIQRTRDKNLRVMLLQRELEARLPTENISQPRGYDEKLASPQLSSPFC